MSLLFITLSFSFHMTTNNSTESCIAGLLDQMTSWSSSNFVTKETVNVHCLCRTLLLNCAIASALSYIPRNAVRPTDCVNNYFVSKNNTHFSLPTYRHTELS